jgi:phosphopantothenoylcysteine decarboxylase/phosphopantothenate--cysteine ligase
MELKLEPTPDILAEVSKIMADRKRHPVVVGFAAESKDLMVNAREKLRAKGLSLIVANDITAPDSGFAVDTNRVTILDAGGGLQELPLMSKMEVAEAVMERVVGLL